MQPQGPTAQRPSEIDHPVLLDGGLCLHDLFGLRSKVRQLVAPRLQRELGVSLGVVQINVPFGAIGVGPLHHDLSFLGHNVPVVHGTNDLADGLLQ